MFFIRCDSSLEIGAGHLMRDLAIAHTLKAKGEKVEFICAPLRGSQHDMATKSGFKLNLLSRSGLSASEDAHESLAIIGAVKDPTVVVDSYNLSDRWESALKPTVRVVAVDDLANRTHSCDVLIDPTYRKNNRYRERYLGLVPKTCRLLLGPRHSFLRPEFVNFRQQGSTRSDDVLVFFGGTDAGDATGKFIRAINSTETTAFFRIVVASGHQRFVEFSRLPAKKNYRIHLQPENLPQMMTECGLFLGSGGTVTYERMYMGLPGLVITVAENQVAFTQNLADDGFQKYLGPSEGLNWRGAIEACEAALVDSAWRKHTSLRGQELVGPLNGEILLRSLNFSGNDGQTL